MTGVKKVNRLINLICRADFKQSNLEARQLFDSLAWTRPTTIIITTRWIGQVRLLAIAPPECMRLQSFASLWGTTSIEPLVKSKTALWALETPTHQPSHLILNLGPHFVFLPSWISLLRIPDSNWRKSRCRSNLLDQPGLRPSESPCTAHRILVVRIGTD